MTTSSKVIITNGMTIRGKWNKRSYHIKRLLGEGANGKVFLVEQAGQVYAMKFGFDPIDLQLEVNVLRALQEPDGAVGAFLHDADDAELQGVPYPFYVMRYIRGETPGLFMRRYGADWMYAIGLHWLETLQRLHRKGWVFGDMKLGNVLVDHTGRVEMVDYGGVTEKGRSVRQFTELYDRGYWNAGDRTADEAYDLFGFAVCCMQLGGLQQPLQQLAARPPQQRRLEQLLALLPRSSRCRPVERVLRRALQGRYSETGEMIAAWKQALDGHQPQLRHTKAKWIPVAFVASLGLFVSTIYMWWQS